MSKYYISQIIIDEVEEIFTNNGIEYTVDLKDGPGLYSSITTDTDYEILAALMPDGNNMAEVKSDITTREITRMALDKNTFFASRIFTMSNLSSFHLALLQVCTPYIYTGLIHWLLQFLIVSNNE